VDQWRHFFVASQQAFWRERPAVFWTFLMPLLLLGLMGSMFSGRAAFARIAVLDGEGGYWSAVFRDRLRATGWSSDDPTRADAVVDLQPRAEAGVAASPGSAAEVRYTTPDRDRSLAVYAMLGAIAHQLNREAGVGQVLRIPEPPFLGEASAAAVDYAHYILFGLMGLNVFSIALFGLGVGVAWQRDLGILRQLWLSPARPGAYLAAQLSSTALITFASTAWLFAAGHLWLDIPPPRWLPFAIVMLVGSVAFAPLGLAIASRTLTPRTAQLWANLVYFPLMMLSGVYFRPGRVSESVADAMSWLPLKPFLDALRAASQGASIPSLVDELAILAAWCGAGMVLARGVFRWNR